MLIAGAAFAAFSIASDLKTYDGGEPLAIGAVLLLGLALLIALECEFVNGFHDTANAVATVIYTQSLPPLFAVIWSGFFNFLGVAVSTSAVAYTIATMPPVELILQTGSAGGYAMIFSLLIAAVTIGGAECLGRPFRPPTSCRAGSPGPWSPTGPDSSGRRFEISRSPRC